MGKTFVFDIDGTLCSFTDGNYSISEPIRDHIAVVNRLHAAGHEIILHTARGMGSTGGNQALAYQKYFQYTSSQLAGWGVRFDKLYMGKPKADLYVDDRGAGLEFFYRSDVLNL
jgi:hypothetical protein